MNLQDFRKSIYENRPQGIYLGIKYLKGKTEDSFWKIDIWFMQDSDAEETLDFVSKNMTDKTRKIILKIKNEMREKRIWGKKISGSEVYKAVISEGVDDLEEFERYLKIQGMKIYLEKEIHI